MSFQDEIRPFDPIEVLPSMPRSLPGRRFVALERDDMQRKIADEIAGTLSRLTPGQSATIDRLDDGWRVTYRTEGKG